MRTETSLRITVQLKLREFAIPAVRDALVVGKQSPIDCPSLRRALALLNPTSFEQIEFEDDVIGDILIRTAILKRIPRDRLISLVVRSVKPHMEITEVIQMDIETEALIADEI